MTGRKVRTLLVITLAAALVITGLSYFLNRRLKTETGLHSNFRAAAGGEAQWRITNQVDLNFLQGARPASPFRVQWAGYWWVPENEVFQFSVSADDFVVLWIDNHQVAEARTKEPQPVFSLLPLSAGIHSIKVLYKQNAGAYDVQILSAVAGKKLRPFDPESLFPEKPEPKQINTNRNLIRLQRISWLVWVAFAGVLIWTIFPPIIATARTKVASFSRPKITKALAIAIPCLIVLYGTALRFEAVVSRFWPIPGSERFVAGQMELANAIRHLHPEPYWDKETRPYIKGDPGGYLRFAREMKHFYEASIREPVFVITTKVFLWLMNDQDVAVSFASAFFSALTIIATYLLGSAVFSRWTGLLASLAVAIEREVIRCGTAGLRDDAFMFATVLFAYACIRLYRKPSVANIVLAGFVGGGACLVRITALSFVVPTYCFLLLIARPWRERVRPIAASAVLAAAVLAPYLISCAIVYGDPLYAINDMTKFYRAREHYEAGESMGVGDYLKMKMTSRPYQFLNTAIIGMTSYPLNNKWSGFDYWSPIIGRLLYGSAIVGLFLLLLSGEGRLILVVLFASILPFAFTWHIKGGAEYRFTVHAYPFYLIAACYALIRFLHSLKASQLAQISAYVKARGRSVAGGIAAAIAVLMLAWFSYRALQMKQFGETLAAGESVTIPADGSAFFADGWSGVVRMREEQVRISTGTESVLRLPLSAGNDHNLSLILDSLNVDPGSQTQLRIFLNKSEIQTIQLEKTSGSIYKVSIPKQSAHSGANDLRLQSPYPFAFTSASLSRAQ